MDPVTVQRRSMDGSAMRWRIPAHRTEDGEIIDLSSSVSGRRGIIVLGQVGETYRGDTEAAVRSEAHS